MLKAVLFDMDGVLLNSERFICEAAMLMFKEKGLIVHPDDFLPFVGSGENKYIGGVAEKYSFALDIDEAKERTYEIYKEITHGRIEPLRGVAHFINKCRAKGLKIAVATSADKIKMIINLGGIGMRLSTFDELLTGEDVVNKKPDPEIYLKAAAKLGVKPSECLVVEDAINGIQAAKAAGARCLAVATSFLEEELTEADWVANHLDAVPDEALNW